MSSRPAEKERGREGEGERGREGGEEKERERERGRERTDSQKVTHSLVPTHTQKQITGKMKREKMLVILAHACNQP